MELLDSNFDVDSFLAKLNTSRQQAPQPENKIPLTDSLLSFSIGSAPDVNLSVQFSPQKINYLLKKSTSQIFQQTQINPLHPLILARSFYEWRNYATIISKIKCNGKRILLIQIFYVIKNYYTYIKSLQPIIRYFYERKYKKYAFVELKGKVLLQNNIIQSKRSYFLQIVVIHRKQRFIIQKQKLLIQKLFIQIKTKFQLLQMQEYQLKITKMKQIQSYYLKLMIKFQCLGIIRRNIGYELMKSTFYKFITNFNTIKQQQYTAYIFQVQMQQKKIGFCYKQLRHFYKEVIIQKLIYGNIKRYGLVNWRMLNAQNQNYFNKILKKSFYIFIDRYNNNQQTEYQIIDKINQRLAKSLFHYLKNYFHKLQNAEILIKVTSNLLLQRSVLFQLLNKVQTVTQLGKSIIFDSLQLNNKQRQQKYLFSFLQQQLVNNLQLFIFAIRLSNAKFLSNTYLIFKLRFYKLQKQNLQAQEIHQFYTAKTSFSALIHKIYSLKLVRQSIETIFIQPYFKAVQTYSTHLQFLQMKAITQKTQQLLNKTYKTLLKLQFMALSSQKLAISHNFLRLQKLSFVHLISIQQQFKFVFLFKQNLLLLKAFKAIKLNAKYVKIANYQYQKYLRKIIETIFHLLLKYAKKRNKATRIVRKILTDWRSISVLQNALGPNEFEEIVRHKLEKMK
ncbi:hypothetical protein SS50377_23762 [Spironucleus salmonicida]|uniref:Uncharacterized protein n=2 Tax=Spironucleus salmonicida TaxID=348837 RepID=A0A9P8RYD8_9EUKA|nr:hypothetical protein SS50377_23762 [Spironucleus salmonicida]